MAAAPLLAPAAAAAIGGVAVLRFAWARPHRSAPLNGAGWALLALAAWTGGAAAGAWGVALAALFGMGAAATFLGVAAARSPAGRGTASNRRVRMLPAAGEPPRIGRRTVTFLLVAVAGLAASIAFSIGLRGAGLALGWSEADANAAALFAVPAAWGVLACVLLMQRRRTVQLLTLALCALPLVPTLVGGA